MKSLMANCSLIGCMLLWVIGVDYMPIMTVLGFPMFLCAFGVWVKYSDTFKRVSRFMDNGLESKYNE